MGRVIRAPKKGHNGGPLWLRGALRKSSKSHKTRFLQVPRQYRLPMSPVPRDGPSLAGHDLCPEPHWKIKCEQKHAKNNQQKRLAIF